MQPRGKICAESEGGVNKICHFLYFLPEIHANTPKNIGKAMVAEQNREKAKRRENGMKSNLTSREAGSVGGQMVKKMMPIRTANYTRKDRTAVGHEIEIRYIASITI